MQNAITRREGKSVTAEVELVTGRFGSRDLRQSVYRSALGDKRRQTHSSRQDEAREAVEKAGKEIIGNADRESG